MGCAMDATGGADPEGATEAANEAVGAPWEIGPLAWNQGDGVLPLRPLATHVCVLTRVTGRLGGGGESVALTHDDSFWYLNGSSQQSGVGAEAWCFPRSGITANDSSSGVSPEFKLSALNNPPLVSSRCLGALSRGAYGGDSATAISKVQGQFNGGGELVSISQSTDTVTASLISASACSPAGVTGSAISFWFGPTKLAVFSDPVGNHGTSTQIPELSASGNGGYAILAPVGKSICYLTRVKGGFFGTGEFAQIRKERIGTIDYWVMRTGQGGASSYVAASARCYARDQR
jgi:hypothetical protein